MSDKTNIEWTDATWNPLRGCQKVSEGCRNCYAARVAARFSGEGMPYEGLAEMTPGGPRWTGKIRLVPEVLDQPLRWKRPRKIFVNSMSDLFHEDVPFDYIDRVFAVMALASHHTFQILTKRPERMTEYFNSVGEHRYYARIDKGLTTEERISSVASDMIFEKKLKPTNFEYDYYDHPEVPGCPKEEWWSYAGPWPLPNVWLGVSVENQKAADERIPLLLQTPAAVRFLSMEPLLGPVDFEDVPVPVFAYETSDCNTGEWVKVPGIDWIITGGESGPGARPMHPDWVRSIRDQCAAAGVPFFFKQWGEWADSGYDGRHIIKDLNKLMNLGMDGKEINDLSVGTNGSELIYRFGKKAAGRLLDGREWNEFPKEESQ